MVWRYIPGWFRYGFPEILWRIHTAEKEIYLTFDDGPTPEVTPYVLEVLQYFNARATFFCLGIQVERHPGLIRNIAAAGHRIGTHGYAHINAWKTPKKVFIKNIKKGISVSAAYTGSPVLFRPPYGKVPLYYRQLAPLCKTVMWDINSADYDPAVPLEQSMKTLKKSVPGSIILFHDTIKAFDSLQSLLPEMMRYWKDRGYSFRAIPHTKPLSN